jgi:O-antigen/teichoic acid export membrane protein
MKPVSSGGFVATSAAYYAAHAVVAVSALVSMPFTTRLLSTEQYGLLSLASASVTLLVAVALMGFTQAMARLLPEERRLGGDAATRFCESMMTGVLCNATLVALIAAAVLPHIGYGPHTATLQLACVVAVARAARSIVEQIYRTQQWVLAYATAQVVARYGTVALAIAMLIGGRGRAADVLIATIVAEGIVAIACLVHLVRRGMLQRLRLAWPHLVRASAYGVPLSIAAAGGFLISYGDRFLIERFLGLDAVARYTVPYDLTWRLAQASFVPIQMAFLPILFHLWAEQRHDAARRLVNELATYLTAAALPLGALFLVLGKDLITVFASAKYVEGAALLPVLLPGIFVGELSFVVASGLRLRKQTVIAAGIAVAGAAANVCLNIILLPRWGLVGAAVATTVTYVGMAVAIYVEVRVVLELRPRLGLIGKSLLVSVAMALAVRAMPSMSPFLVVDLGLRGTAGLLIAAGGLWSLDRDVRLRLRQLWRSINAALPRTARVRSVGTSD